MTTTTPPTVTLEHWRAFRVTAGDIIERYSLTHDGQTVLTFVTELEARRAAREYGWIVTDTVDLGWITLPPPPTHPRGEEATER